jgi:hypothetical protein
MPTVEALEGIAADLRARIAALEERIAKIPPANLTAVRAQRFNVEDLASEARMAGFCALGLALLYALAAVLGF